MNSYRKDRRFIKFIAFTQESSPFILIYDGNDWSETFTPVLVPINANQPQPIEPKAIQRASAAPLKCSSRPAPLTGLASALDAALPRRRGALLAPQLQRIFFHICFDGIPWYCMVLLAIVWYCMVWALACCWYSELPRIFCYIRILHPWHQPGRPLRGRVRGVPGHQRVHLLWYCDCTKPRCHTSAISKLPASARPHRRTPSSQDLSNSSSVGWVCGGAWWIWGAGMVATPPGKRCRAPAALHHPRPIHLPTPPCIPMHLPCTRA